MSRKVAKGKRLVIRFATKKDTPIILSFIKQLAAFEKLGDQVTTSKPELQKNLFGRNKFARVLLAIYGDSPVGFALFFNNFSTFLGRPGIYLEDLYVAPRYRSLGIGKKLLENVIAHAKSQNCGRVEWSVLNWNHRAISFYKTMGAKPVKGWTVFRWVLKNSKD